MDAIMSMQAIEQARLEWTCQLAGAAGNPGLLPRVRPLTSRETTALAAPGAGTWACENLGLAAALHEECWRGGCVCEEEAFPMHAASSAELGCPGFCGLPDASREEAV